MSIRLCVCPFSLSDCHSIQIIKQSSLISQKAASLLVPIAYRCSISHEHPSFVYKGLLVAGYRSLFELQTKLAQATVRLAATFY
jgi:hypothetical protein